MYNDQIIEQSEVLINVVTNEEVKLDVNNSTNYEIHEWAKLFPKMTDDEYNNLADDIVINGLYDAIMIYQNKIVDGTHRYQAYVKHLDMEHLHHNSDIFLYYHTSIKPPH